jgi:hypothetical protein
MATAASSLVRRAAAAASSRLLHARAFASGGGDKAKRVLVPVAAGTEPIEAAATADVLNRAGARVTVATADPPGDDGLVVEAAYGVKLVADGRVADMEGEDFDLIALPVRSPPRPPHSCRGPRLALKSTGFLERTRLPAGFLK